MFWSNSDSIYEWFGKFYVYLRLPYIKHGKYEG